MSDYDDDNELQQLSRIATQIDPNDSDNVLHRFETIMRHLSRVKTRETFTIEPSDFDLEAILKSTLKNYGKSNSVLRSSGVVLKHLHVVGEDKSAAFAKTFGSVLNIPGSIAQKFKTRKYKPERHILSDINALVEPGEMCLVLGKPGAGCTTLLKCITAEGLEEYKSIKGEVLYDGVEQQTMMKHYRNDVVYNPELDVHLPHLTVKQTLDFAVSCKVPNSKINAVTSDATYKQYVNFKVDLLATIFGLRHTYNTKVGNDFVRGVSGGERKRVSVAEALAADAKVYGWDNATRGLDASTALEFAVALRTLSNVLNATNFVTIYQASQNIYENFNKVLVLYEGRQIYFGKVEDAKQYFENMGFECPNRQVTPEFLTAMTDPKGRFPKAGMEHKVPNTPDEFEHYWHTSPEFAQLQKDIEVYESNCNAQKTLETFAASSKAEKSNIKSRYTVSYMEQLRLNVNRSYQCSIGDPSYLIITIVSDIFQAFINGSMFYNTPKNTSGAFSRGGVLFFCILYFALAGVSSVSNCYAKRPVLVKQRAYSFYRPSAEFLASIFTDASFKMIGLVLFILIAFFLSGLKREAGHFFTVLLCVLTGSLCMNALFQSIATLTTSLSIANSICGLVVMFSVMYSGFMIQLPSMHPWFKWINYINPIRYAFESLISSEFHGTEMSCAQLVPSGAGYENVSLSNVVCSFTGAISGENYVKGDNYLKLAFSYYFKYCWRDWGIVLSMFVFLLAVSAIASEFIKSDNAGFDVLVFKKTPGTAKLIERRRYLNSKTDSESLDEKRKSSTASELSQNDIGEEEKQKMLQGLGSKDIFSWKNLNYDITLKDGTVRRLLNDVQGYVRPGTLTALMGESGAGKTTLLNALSQRLDVGVITGSMLVNASPLPSSFKRKTGYVQQQDLHVAEMTVRESLRFAAQLRRPMSVPDSEKFEYVESVMAILGMTSYADALVGTPGFGLNVEQRKKLSIGVELVSKPSLLLFLDEPTSGLDSQSSWSIIKLLRDLAAAGQAILCTIHQPSATLFEEFDRLLLLKKGGYTVYFGDIGKNSRTVLDYFEANGGRKASHDENPAEYVLEVIGAGATASAVQDWGETWKQSPQCLKATEEIDQIRQEAAKNIDSQPANGKEDDLGTFVTPYWYQLMLVTKRCMQIFYRDSTYIMSKLSVMILSGLIIGFTFWNSKTSVISMQNLMFSVFLSLIAGIPLMNQIQDRALATRELFEVRESKSNTYHWSTLLLAQFLNEIPYNFVFSTFFFIIYYFTIYRNYGSFYVGAFYLFYCIMFQLYYMSFSLWIIFAAPDLPSAGALTTALFSMCIAFCGVVQPSHLMPGFWHFMWRVSPLTYFVESFMAISLHKMPVQCKKTEFVVFQPPSGKTCIEFASAYINRVGGYIANESATSDCNYCSYKVGDEYLKSLNLSFSHLWRNFGLLWVYVGFNICAMVFCYWFFRLRTTSLSDLFKKKKAAKKAAIEA